MTVDRVAAESGLGPALATNFVVAMGEAIAERGIFRVALSGGRTPVALYEVLREETDLDWDRVEFFFSDERLVSPDAPESNHALADRHLFQPLGIDPGRVHPMAQTLRAEDDAARYQNLLEHIGGPEGLDLVLLGMGADGHTASLFPDDPSLEETDRWVVPSLAPVAPHARLTFTYPALVRARRCTLACSGADKADAIRQLPEGVTPASRLAHRRPTLHVVVWLP